MQGTATALPASAGPKTVADTTWYYIRDPQGNVLAVYKKWGSTVQIRERHLYGSARLGIYDSALSLNNDTALQRLDETENVLFISRGCRKDELSNHLGNVMVVVSDRRLPRVSGTMVTGYNPDILQKSEYSFGADLPGWGKNLLIYAKICHTRNSSLAWYRLILQFRIQTTINEAAPIPDPQHCSSAIHLSGGADRGHPQMARTKSRTQ